MDEKAYYLFTHWKFKKKIANNLQSNLFKLSLRQKELLITKERRIHTFHWKYLTQAKNIAN